MHETSYPGPRDPGTQGLKDFQMRDYTKIEAWKLADDLTVLIYQITKAFPKEELYGLTTLFRRSFACLIGLISAVERESGMFGIQCGSPPHTGCSFPCRS